MVSSVWSSWKDLEKSKNDSKLVDQKKQILEQLQANPQIKDIGQIASKYIPQEADSGQLVIELTAMAQTNKLSVRKTSMDMKKAAPAPVASSDEIKSSPNANASAAPTAQPVDTLEVPFSMSLEGSYNDFLNFLRSIDSSSRLIALQVLSLKKNTITTENEQTQTLFYADITGVAFYKKDVTIEKNLDNLKVSNETITKFLNLKTYGMPINLTTEAGFGRTNPFDGY